MGKLLLEVPFEGCLEVAESVKGEISFCAPAPEIVQRAQFHRMIFDANTIEFMDNRGWRKYASLCTVRLSQIELKYKGKLRWEHEFQLQFQGVLEGEASLPRGVRLHCCGHAYSPLLTLEGVVNAEIPDITIYHAWYFSYYLGRQQVTERFLIHCLRSPEWATVGEPDFLIADGDLDLARKIHGRAVAFVDSPSPCPSTRFYDENRSHSQCFSGYLDFLDSIVGSRYSTRHGTIIVPEEGSVGEMLVRLLSHQKLDEGTARRLRGLSLEEILAELLAREF